MSKLFERLDRKKSRDLRVLSGFVSIYCREQHRNQEKSAFPITDERLRRILDHREVILCQDCQKLLIHGIAKRLQCPYAPKPMCKKCKTHCYAPRYREKMQEVMRFSGIYLIRHGRLDLLFHYLF